MNKLTRLLLVWLSGCGSTEAPFGPPSDFANCSANGGQIAIAVNPRFSVTPTSGTVEISGTATHSRGLSIRRILVGGKTATSDSFNFATWHAQLSAEDIARVASSMSGMSGELVAIPVQAFDVCSPAIPRGEATFTTTVQAAVQTRVSRVSLEHHPEPGLTAGIAPIGRSLEIEATANVEASGVAAQLALSSGTSGATFSVGDSRTAMLTLLATDENKATGRFSIIGRAAGVAVVTITAGAVAQSLPVTFVGPPTLLPLQQTALPRQRVILNLIFGTATGTCEVSPSISRAFIIEGFNPDGTIAIADSHREFAFTRTLEDGPSLTVTCRDAFQQAGRATIVAGVAADGG